MFSYNRSRFHDLAKTIRMPKWRRRARTRAWAEARGAFEAALRICEIPEALKGLGTAAWWLDLADLVFDSRERAYRLYLALGDRAGAARVGVWLAWDYWAFRGTYVPMAGCSERAACCMTCRPARSAPGSKCAKARFVCWKRAIQRGR